MNVIQFSREMTRNEKLAILLWDFFETHECSPGDALEILDSMTRDIKEALQQ